jgi:hypothetical protein
MTKQCTVMQNKWADPPNEVEPIQVKTRTSNNFEGRKKMAGKIMNKD